MPNSIQSTKDKKAPKRRQVHNYRVIFLTGPPLKFQVQKVNLGVSRTIYVNVDSPNQGFPYF